MAPMQNVSVGEEEGEEDFAELLVVGQPHRSRAAPQRHEGGQHSHSHGDKGCCEAGAQGDSSGGSSGAYKVPTIFDVVKSGQLIPVQTLVESYGADILQDTDEKGYTPAHWACLLGQKVIFQYIVDQKGLFNEPGRDEVGQRPIHWACINGHIQLVDLLLRFDVSIDIMDHKGCTPLIVAAQYGQTMLTGYLIGKGAKLFITDKEGDTALHWAAFKGHHELMRLLVYSGFNAHQLDIYGQTPLHLACISGNIRAVRDLCEHDKAEVNLMDKKGKTPLSLAIGRRHEKIVSYLKKESRRQSRLFPIIDSWTIVFGPPGNTRCPIMFLIISVLFWGYPLYIYKCVPMLWDTRELLHIFFIGVNIIMWISLYCACTIDPGFIPINQPEYDRCLKQVTVYDEWRNNENPLSRLCHTCRCVKPTRSKHCRICNRCIVTMDHHCPYIYNCVGINNRGWFFSFVTCAFLLFLITDYFCVTMLSEEVEWDWIVFIGLMESSFFLIISSVVLTMTIYHIRMNLTTNERVNCKRYKYLQDSKGRYHNPYDRGCKRNVLEFFSLQRPLTEEEVEFLNVTII